MGFDFGFFGFAAACLGTVLIAWTALGSLTGLATAATLTVSCRLVLEFCHALNYKS
jgi:hypothetical protein